MDTYRNIMTDWNNDDSCTLTMLPVCDLLGFVVKQSALWKNQHIHLIKCSKPHYMASHQKEPQFLTYNTSLILAIQPLSCAVKLIQKEIVTNIVSVLLGISRASIRNMPTFRNHVSVPSSKAGSRLSTSSLWRWNWYMLLKCRHITDWHRGNTQKNRYNIQVTAKAWNLQYVTNIVTTEFQ